MNMSQVALTMGFVSSYMKTPLNELQHSTAIPHIFHAACVRGILITIDKDKVTFLIYWLLRINEGIKISIDGCYIVLMRQIYVEIS
jgi:hypothetical protein